MRLFKTAGLIFIFLCICHLHADIMIINSPGHSLQPKKKTAIRMKHETVDITVGEESRVRARFVMFNPSDQPESVTVGFPINPPVWEYYTGDREIDYKFTARMNEKPVKMIYSYSKEELDGADDFLKPYYQVVVKWFGWEATFPPGKTVVEVNYEIDPYYSYKRNIWNIKYIFSTGAAWAGPIGEAQLNIHFPNEVGKDQILSSTNPKNFQIYGKTITWSRKNFEPTTKDNVHLECIPPKLYKKMVSLRKQIRNHPKNISFKLELSRIYFKNILTMYIYPLYFIQKDQFNEILKKIPDPDTREFFCSVYKESDDNYILNFDGTRYIHTKKAEKRIFRILHSLAHFPAEHLPYKPFGDEIKRHLLKAIDQEPTNSKVWNTYLAYFGRIYPYGNTFYAIFEPNWHPPEYLVTVLRAKQLCPRDPGIQLWFETIDDGIKRIPDTPMLFRKTKSQWEVEIQTIRPNFRGIRPLTKDTKKHIKESSRRWENLTKSDADILLKYYHKQEIPGHPKTHLLAIKSRNLKPRQRKELWTVFRKLGFDQFLYADKLAELYRKNGIIPGYYDKY